MHLDLDANLASASTLPSELYVDPGVLELEVDRIFSRTWQLVAHGDDLARVGDRGRFCARRENGLHHFQSLVKEFLERP